MANTLEPYVNHRRYKAPPPTPPQLMEIGYTPRAASTALATLPPEPYRPNFTMGQNQAAPVPESPVTDVRAKYNQANGSPEAKAWQASRQPVATPAAPTTPTAPAGPSAGSRMTQAFQQFTGVNGNGYGSKVLGAAGKLGAGALNIAGKLAMPLAVGNEALQVGRVAMDPNSTGNDIAAQTAQGFGRLGAAGAGAAAGAALGSVVPVVGTAIGGLAGGVLGYLGADKAIETGRSALGVEPRAPAAPSPTTAAAATATPTPPSPVTKPMNSMGKGYDDPRLLNSDPSRATLGASRDYTKELNTLPAQLPTDLRQGVIHKTMGPNGSTTYSGMNVKPDANGNTQMVDGMGKTLQSRGSVAMNTMQAMPQAEINRALTNPDGSRWSANDNAIMAANIRDGVNPYRGTSRGIAEAAQNDLQNLALSPNGTPGKGNAMKLLAMQADDKRSAAQQQIEKDRNADQAKLTAQQVTGSTMDNKIKQQLFDAQTELSNAKTPAEEAAAEKKLRALQWKYGKETPDLYDKYQTGVDPATGAPIFALYNKHTGLPPPGQQATAKGGVQAPTTKAEYDKLPKGAKYTHPDGTTRTKG